VVEVEKANSRCTDETCCCNGTGHLIWVADYHRWKHQLLCDRGGLILLEVDGLLEVYDYSGDTLGLKGNPVRDAPPEPKDEDFIRCAHCNRLVLKRGQHQKYCLRCTKIMNKARKREWIKRRRSSTCHETKI